MERNGATTIERIYKLTCRRLQNFFDWPSGLGFSFSIYISSMAQCLLKFDLVSSVGLVFSIKHCLILMAALKSRFTNSTRLW